METLEIKLLYLENDRRQLELMSGRFVKRGLSVITAPDIEKARKLIEKNVPSFFLFDLALGAELNGFEFAKDICLSKRVAYERFFFLTAFDDKFNIPSQFCREHVFSKPIRSPQIDQLARLIFEQFAKMNRAKK